MGSLCAAGTLPWLPKDDASKLFSALTTCKHTKLCSSEKNTAFCILWQNLLGRCPCNYFFHLNWRIPRSKGIGYIQCTSSFEISLWTRLNRSNDTIKINEKCSFECRNCLLFLFIKDEYCTFSRKKSRQSGKKDGDYILLLLKIKHTPNYLN